jgi:hypothetical protein
MEANMSLLFKYLVTGKNFTTTTRNGKRTATPITFTFQGDTQPLSSRETVALTAGRISSGMIVVLSETPLVISTEGASDSARGTYVLFEGKWYEVTGGASANTPVSELMSINHYEYTAEYRKLDTV